MNYRSWLPASLLLRLVVLASVVSVIDGHQYFEGIYCGQDNCYDCKRFITSVLLAWLLVLCYHMLWGLFVTEARVFKGI